MAPRLSVTITCQHVTLVTLEYQREALWILM